MSKDKEVKKPIDWKYCRRCGHEIRVLGDKFCSEYCERNYKIEQNERFG